MKKLIEMDYEGEGSILVGVEIPELSADIEDEDFIKVSVLDYFKGKTEKVDENFNTVNQMIIKCGRSIIRSFEDLGKERIPPEKATAEFGLSFTGKGNIYLVESSAEASIKISLEWNLKPTICMG